MELPLTAVEASPRVLFCPIFGDRFGRADVTGDRRGATTGRCLESPHSVRGAPRRAKGKNGKTLSRHGDSVTRRGQKCSAPSSTAGHGIGG